MSTLILSPFFFPELISTGRYNTVLAQCLVNRGEKVTVLASHPLYPNWRPERSSASLPKVSIRRGGAWVRYPKEAFFRRAVLETWYTAFACFKYLRLAAKPQHVIPILPPCLFLVFLRPLLPKGTSVVGIVHDLQGVLAARSGSWTGRLLRACIGWIERRSFASCDRLIFLSRSMAERAIRDYGLRRDVCSVHYPFQTLPQKSAERSTGLEQTMSDTQVNVVYSGALGDKQSPDQLVQFMMELSRRSPTMRCHIFSAGPHFERLNRQWSGHAECTVGFHPLVSEDQLDELYARSTVQLIPQADGTADGALPSKLPNLLAAGVPIFAICATGSDVEQILSESAGGATAPDFFSNETMQRFDTLLSTLAAEPRSARIERLKPFVERYFSVESVVDAILNH